MTITGGFAHVFLIVVVIVHVALLVVLWWEKQYGKNVSEWRLNGQVKQESRCK